MFLLFPATCPDSMVVLSVSPCWAFLFWGSIEGAAHIQGGTRGRLFKGSRGVLSTVRDRPAAAFGAAGLRIQEAWGDCS